MPVYLYKTAGGQTFEVEQPASDEPLKKHPVTGERVERVFTAPNLGGKYSAKAEKKLLDPKRTAKAGFARYERGAKGEYHKISGEGPQTLKAD